MNAAHSIAIVTGASRGLGRALAEQLAARGARLLTLQRTVPEGLPGEHWRVDLADAAPAAERLRTWLRALPAAAIERAVLVNNAGVLSRLAPLDDVPLSDLAHALRVGLEAPALLTAAFLEATRDWTAPRRVLLVSSGLARRAMAGSASYCAAKAGLDHLARAVALEEAERANGARIASIAPGVIDTDMQAQLRGADPEAFPARERFVALAAQRQLDSPAAAAAKLIARLDRDDFGSEPVGDVRD